MSTAGLELRRAVPAAAADGRAARTGCVALCEQLLADGIRYVFGNPGTVEQGFPDALASYPALQYVFAVQETVEVGIADGCARETHRPAVVQLHSGVGPGTAAHARRAIREALETNGPVLIDLVIVPGDTGHPKCGQ